MKRKLVLRLIRCYNRIRRREKLYRYSRKKSKFVKFLNRNEKPLGFLLRVLEFIAKLISIIVSFSHKTYLEPQRTLLIQSY